MLVYSLVLSYETIAQGHLFTACIFLLRSSQPKASDLRGEEGTGNEEVVLHNGFIAGIWGQLYRMAKKAI